MSGVAYGVLQWRLLASDTDTRELARHIGYDLKGKVSLLAYSSAIAVSFVSYA